MHWQFIVGAGFVVTVALFLAALFLYSNLRGSHNTGQEELRLRTDRAVTRSTTETDCRG
jgi:hypothetical protein